MYRAFISYRKASSINADFIRQSITDNSAYSLEDIFLDKHSIGPERFDDKIKQAIEESNCIVLLVTNGCFVPKKKAEEDWFIEEIKAAISLEKKIIPVLFDKISSLTDENIVSELKKSFSPQEIEILIKSQCIPYSDDYPDASIEKLVVFITEANKADSLSSKIAVGMKLIAAIAIVLVVFFTLFFGLGFLWGYLASSTKEANVLVDNTTIKENVLNFDYNGWKAAYDLNNDTIVINISEFNNQPKIGNLDLILSSMTFAGAKLIIERNLSYLKYLQFLRKGSKPAKIAFVCISVVACVGSFCGFSQGSNFGRSKRQEEVALALYPKLQKRSTWEPIIKKNDLLSGQYQWWRTVKNPRGLAIGKPNDYTCIAYKAGMRQAMILLKYNNWEIGCNNFLDLLNEIKISRDKDKIFVFLTLDEETILDYYLPAGQVGIAFEPHKGNEEWYDIAIEKFMSWKGSSTQK